VSRVCRANGTGDLVTVSRAKEQEKRGTRYIFRYSAVFAEFQIIGK